MPVSRQIQDTLSAKTIELLTGRSRPAPCVQAKAHINPKGEPNPLENHLTYTALFARNIGKKFGLPNLAELIARCHDLGKALPEFQEYLKKSWAYTHDQDLDDGAEAPVRGSVDHSTAGALFLWLALPKRNAMQQVFAQMLAMAVASHHSGLFDCLRPDGSERFLDRMQKGIDADMHHEALLALPVEARLKLGKLLFKPALERELINLQKLINPGDRKLTPRQVHFRIGVMTRLLLSVLLDADRISTSNFMKSYLRERRQMTGYAAWATLRERLETRLATFVPNNDVNRLRKKISDDSLAAATRRKGIYTLTVPTGGGKTLSSLRFAMAHAEMHGLDRIIYVIPYTSIIDQNAQEVREILEPEGTPYGSVVLEHHGNLLPEKETFTSRLLTENWDAPIVYTTSVQVLNALFGQGTRNARRLHQLANAVLIFDEAQALPIKSWHMLINSLNLLKACGSTMVMCTATQPNYKALGADYGELELEPEAELMPNVALLFEALNRVTVENLTRPEPWTNQDISALACNSQRKSPTNNVLLVCNTKSNAKFIHSYCELARPDIPIYHLSTNMCPEHRMGVLKEVLAKIKNNEPLICISTQLIEAGINISFGIVIRMLAGFDSIAQCAGRSNRNGEIAAGGRLLIINGEQDHTETLEDIEAGKQVAEVILSGLTQKEVAEDLLRPEIMRRYFTRYHDRQQHKMAYPVEDGDYIGSKVFDLLGDNAVALGNWTKLPQETRQAKKPMMTQAFETAGNLYAVIDADTVSVIAPYKNPESGVDSRVLVGEFLRSDDVREQRTLLKRLGRFSVNIFRDPFEKMIGHGLVRELQPDPPIYMLVEAAYHPETGMLRKLEK